MEVPMALLASDYDKSKYLRAEDVKQDRKLRIKAVTSEGFDKEGGKEHKLVLWFSNDDRGLVINKTNNRTLRGAFDDDTSKWVGKVIAVFPMMTEFRGKMVNALRVRIPPPKEAAASASNGAATAATAAEVEAESAAVKSPKDDDMDDEIPF
jgi:hypothetical protein